MANPLISETKTFISGLAVPLTFKNYNGLVIEAISFGSDYFTKIFKLKRIKRK